MKKIKTQICHLDNRMLNLILNNNKIDLYEEIIIYLKKK